MIQEFIYFVNKLSTDMAIKLTNVAIQLDVELGKDKFINVAEVTGESFEEINNQLQEFGGSLASYLSVKGYEVKYDAGIRGNIKDFFRSGEGTNPYSSDVPATESETAAATESSTN